MPGPGLDWVCHVLHVAPLIIGPIIAGWIGLLGAVIGQVASVMIWIQLHELANRDATRGPRIVSVLNRIVGRWRNHAALW